MIFPQNVQNYFQKYSKFVIFSILLKIFKLNLIIEIKLGIGLERWLSGKVCQHMSLCVTHMCRGPWGLASVRSPEARVVGSVSHVVWVLGTERTQSSIRE